MQEGGEFGALAAAAAQSGGFRKVQERTFFQCCIRTGTTGKKGASEHLVRESLAISGSPREPIEVQNGLRMAFENGELVLHYRNGVHRWFQRGSGYPLLPFLIGFGSFWGVIFSCLGSAFTYCNYELL